MATASQTPNKRPHRRLTWAFAGLLAVLVAGFAISESLGWPFLAEPARQFLQRQLGRSVLFGEDGRNTFKLHLWGSPRLQLGWLQIDNPPSIDLGPMLVGQGIELQMRWSDLLQWRPSRAVHLRSLSADELTLRLQRRSDGQASWQFGDNSANAQPAKPAPSLDDVVRIDELQLRRGSLRLIDEPLQLDLRAQFADGGPAGAASASTTVAAAASGGASANNSGTSRNAAASGNGGSGGRGGTDSAGGPTPSGLRASAEGSFRKQPLTATLMAASAPRWLSSDAAAPAVPLALRLTVGRADFNFAGTVRRPLGEREVQGRFHIAGPSLAAVGEPLRLTLPQTRHFAMDGLVSQTGYHWKARVEKATIGASRLDGSFTFDLPPDARPLLAGRLHASTLLLQDLGPAIGGASETQAKTTRSSGRVLPDRSFDLPSLRAMDANVIIDFDRFDFGTSALQAAAPLRAHLVLQGGQLGIEDITARLAQGRISGFVRLDGRQPLARWNVDLRGNGLVLEQWVQALQRPGKAPYAAGVLGGRVTLTGQGKSTAQLLGSADGRVQAFVTRGKISHLAVELAGLDLAQALGVALRGDNALQVTCSAADLAVSKGRMTPRVMLVDTPDSTIWMDGNLSLADEQMALVARVQPKDWSPLSLRTPLHIDGAWSKPELSLEKAPLLKRVVPATLLAMLNPLAALLPLMDVGQDGPSTKACTDALAVHQRQQPSTGRDATARPSNAANASRAVRAASPAKPSVSAVDSPRSGAGTR